MTEKQIILEDLPINLTLHNFSSELLKEFLEKKDPRLFYPAHFYGRKREFIHIERLSNLEKLPATGFKVSCFPVRIKNTGAAWARAVAFIENEH